MSRGPAKEGQDELKGRSSAETSPFFSAHPVWAMRRMHTSCSGTYYFIALGSDTCSPLPQNPPLCATRTVIVVLPPPAGQLLLRRLRPSTAVFPGVQPQDIAAGIPQCRAIDINMGRVNWLASNGGSIVIPWGAIYIFPGQLGNGIFTWVDDRMKLAM